MARNDDKIFKQLHELSVTPPPEMWDEIKLRLFENDGWEEFKRLRDYELEPQQDNFKDIVNRIEENKLASTISKLQLYEVEPSAALSKRTIAASLRKNQRTTGLLYEFKNYRKLIAAAAVVTIIVSILSLVMFIKNRGSIADETVAGVGNKEVDSAKKISTVEVEQQLKERLPQKHRARAGHLVKPGFFAVHSMRVDGFDIPVSDNDLLLSFVAFKPRGKRIYLVESKGSTTIDIGNGTNIAISKYMTEVINDLYQVKRNGKPTWKAKRTKAKILRWRKDDARKFSKKKKNNPLDLIDLADNVY